MPKTSYKDHQNNAEKFFRIGMFNIAEKALKTCIKINPDDTDNYYALGVIYYNLKDFDKAIINLKKDPLNSDALFLIGRIYYEKEDYKKAIEYAKTAIKTNPETLRPYRLLSSIYLIKKEFEKAKECCEKRIQNNNDDPGAYYSLASCYAELGEYKKAIDYYRKAIKLWEKTIKESYTLEEIENKQKISYAYYWIGYYYIDKLKKEEKGLNALTKSLNLGYKKARDQIEEFALDGKVTIKIIH